MIESPQLLGCILSTENGLRMMYWANRSMSSRLRGGTRWLRWTLNPECIHPRRIRARSGGRSPFFTRNVMTRARKSSPQRSQARLGHHVEKPAVHKEPVGGQRVKVRMVGRELNQQECRVAAKTSSWPWDLKKTRRSAGIF